MAGQNHTYYGICKITKAKQESQDEIEKKAREVFQIKAGDTIMVLGDEAQGIALVKADDMIDFVQQALKMANQKDKN